MIMWSEKYRIGIDIIDYQHRQLFNLINRLSKGKTENQIEVLKELVEYVKFHFSAEEKIMKKLIYPNYISHKNQHENFKKKILRFLMKYKRGNLSMLEIQSYIEDWISNHILYEDMKIGKFLSGKEIQNFSRSLFLLSFFFP